MPEWLIKSFANGQPLHWDDLIGRLALALVLGSVVAAVYWVTHRRDESLAWGFVTTLVLLTLLIAMVTQVIGENVARAFSLVGALSIIRFRTVVEDTRDTAFVICSVVVGMAVGAQHVEVALVGLCFVGLAAGVMCLRSGKTTTAGPFWNLNIRVGIAHNPEELLAPHFRGHFLDTQLLAAATGRQGAAIDLTYKVRLRPTGNPTAIVGELNRLEGVQSVELRCL